MAGVGGLELANVALQKAWSNSLVFQNIFVPETFRAAPKKYLWWENVAEFKEFARCTNDIFFKTAFPSSSLTTPATQSGLREQKYEMVLRRAGAPLDATRRDLRPTATGCVSNIRTRFYLEHVAVDFPDMPIILAHPSFAWQ
jgi:hypothetical protein